MIMVEKRKKKVEEEENTVRRSMITVDVDA